jgi:hypothetical protein
MRFASAVLAAGILTAATTAQGDERNCNEPAGIGNLTNIALGEVTAPKANFVADQRDNAACPSANIQCQRKAFVMAGNVLVFDTSTAKTGYVCAAYVSAKGRETDGWLPVSALKAATPAPDWIGTWKRDTSASIEVKRKTANAAELSGDATWGQGEGTNVGDISTTIDPRQAVQGFGTASDEQTQTAYGKGDPQACAVIFKQLGPYLFASDNNTCGGMNVTFSGVYVKR